MPSLSNINSMLSLNSSSSSNPNSSYSRSALFRLLLHSQLPVSPPMGCQTHIHNPQAWLVQVSSCRVVLCSCSSRDRSCSSSRSYSSSSSRDSSCCRSRTSSRLKHHSCGSNLNQGQSALPPVCQQGSAFCRRRHPALDHKQLLQVWPPWLCKSVLQI